MTDHVADEERPDSIGALLLAARRKAELRQNDVVAATSLSQPKLSRIERGEAYPVVNRARQVDDVAELSDLYGISERDRDWIYDVLDRRDERRYTVVQGADVLAVQARFRRLSRMASRVRAWSTNGVIVGELQSRRMAAAIFDVAENSPEVEERLLRHAAHPDNAHRLYEVVLHESVIGWRMVPADVLADQLDDMVKVSRLPNVDLRWIPTWQILAPPRVPALSIYDEPTSDPAAALRQTVIIGQVDGAATLTEQWALDRYTAEFERLREAGLVGDEARARISAVAENLRT